MAILKQRLHRKNDSGTYDTVYLENLATNVKLSETDETTVFNAIKYDRDLIANNNTLISSLNTEVSSLKSSVSEGKSLIASAITDKGVSTASSATFQVMSDNIRNIPVGIFPSGSKSITSNGSYDISAFASVDVNVNGVVVAYIKATVPSGTTNIYANGNGTNINPIEVNGIYFFNVPSLGTWTIYGTRNGSTKSTSVGVWSNGTAYSVDLTSLFAFKITLVPTDHIGDMDVKINGTDYALGNESLAGDYYTTSSIDIIYNTRFSNSGYVYVNGTQQTTYNSSGYQSTKDFTYTFTPTKDTRIAGDYDSYSSRICRITY